MRLSPRLSAVVSSAAVLLAGCRTVVQGPDDVATRYAQALSENRLEDAYALTSEAQRAHLPRDAFLARYADEAKRLARASEILASVPQMRARTEAVEAVREPQGWRVGELEPTEGPREVLTRFLSAVEARDFDAAYALLAPKWRERYTPARLKDDFAAEPAALERLARIKAALNGPLAMTAEGAELPLAGGKAVRLVREAQGYKVASLE